MALVVKKDICTGCGICRRVCPKLAVKIECGKAAINEKCVECLTCIEYCPEKAIDYAEAKLQAIHTSLSQ